MAEYGGKQRNQLSKVTGSSESKDVQLRRFIDNRPHAVSQMNLIRSIQKKPNNTGLPDNLKSGVENLSGFSMDDVKVHYNSDKPAQLNALAYAQGTDIHVAPGQEKHLPHEAWHVVQQKQGRVQPVIQLQGTNVNNNEEKEADVMGEKVLQRKQYEIQKTFPLVKYEKKIEKVTETKEVKEKKGSKTVTKTLEELEKERKSNAAKLGDKISSAEKALKSPITTEQHPYHDKIVGLRAEEDKIRTGKYDEEISLKRAKLPHLKEEDLEGNRDGRMAETVKKLFPLGINWMGGHLIKDAWGGLDNMMNVAVWNKDNAEKEWSEKFEDPLDGYFLLDDNTESATVHISAVKEDEILSKDSIDIPRLCSNGDAYLQKKYEEKRWEINNAIETIPLSAQGSFKTNNDKKGSVYVTESQTGYSAIKEPAKNMLEKHVDDIKTLHESIEDEAFSPIKNTKYPSQGDVEKSSKEKRTAKRAVAMSDEYNRLITNLQDSFFQDIEPSITIPQEEKAVDPKTKREATRPTEKLMKKKTSLDRQIKELMQHINKQIINVTQLELLMKEKEEILTAESIDEKFKLMISLRKQHISLLKKLISVH